MTPDDPRHGTSAGYCAGCHDTCCRVAIAAYSRHLRTRQYLAGGPLVIDAVGTKRRLRALMALGWSGRQLDTALGKKPTYTTNLLCGSPRVTRVTAALVARVYEQMSMKLPEAAPGANHQVIARSRSEARRKGWAPPLAWNDIDDPDEDPNARMSEEERWVRWWESRGYHDTDQSAVERILAGDWRLRCSKADKEAVVARWTGSWGELEDLTGWKLDRYVTRAEVAA